MVRRSRKSTPQRMPRTRRANPFTVSSEHSAMRLAPNRTWTVLLLAVVLSGCSSSESDANAGDAGTTDAAGTDGGAVVAMSDSSATGMPDAPRASESGPAQPCTTHVAYGNAWIHSSSHPSFSDVASGDVEWDGTCTDEGTNSYAVLSNGWKPYFTGHSACVLALDHSGACPNVPSSCTTRITYGSTWLSAPNHPNPFDDVAGRVFSDAVCHGAGGQSYVNLSNGWTPYFSANSACEISFRYEECGGLYSNPVIDNDCPDPGVLGDGNQYVLTCTSGGAPNAYPIYTSPDLASWTQQGHVFPADHKPVWATGDFWAPEIHHVGSGYVVYFSARGTDGVLAVGAAAAPSALGPFTDLGHPLVHDASMGLIDASEITDANGTPYVLWKEDGNAVGRPTPIHAQQLTADGTALGGAPATLITNDQPWEGNLVEGPFMVEHAGSYYLFYSGNAYYDARYAVGVAVAPSPTGPFTKAGGPI